MPWHHVQIIRLLERLGHAGQQGRPRAEVGALRRRAALGTGESRLLLKAGCSYLAAGSDTQRGQLGLGLEVLGG